MGEEEGKRGRGGRIRRNNDLKKVGELAQLMVWIVST